MDDTPNFLKPKEPQECKDFAQWQIHFAIAHFVLLGLGIIIGVFIGNYLAGIVLIAASIGVFAYAGHQATKHAKWHLENDKKGKH